MNPKHQRLQFERDATPDAKFKRLADMLAIALDVLNKAEEAGHPATVVFLDAATAVQTELLVRGRHLARLN